MIALKKNLAPQKKSPTLTSLFFSSFPPCPSSFLLPYSNFWRCVPYLYISTSLHLSDTPPKIFRPCGAKREEEKEEKRGRKKEEKENIITYNFRRPSRRAVVVVKARFWLPFPYIQLPLFNILSIHSHSLVVGVFFTSRFFFLQLRGSNSARAIYNIHMFLRNRYILCNH